MSTRREALRLVAILPAAVPAAKALQETKERTDQPGHFHDGPTVKVADPGKPTFLQPDEYKTAEALSECIIPRTDTPGAKDAGVALLIDRAIVVSAWLGPRCRQGLADLNVLAAQSYGSEFVALTAEQQVAVLTPLSLENETAMAKFFDLWKGLTVDAYYKTEAGLKTELGWHGNTYLRSFPGCEHPGHHGDGSTS